VSASLPTGGGLQINVKLPLPPPNQTHDPDD
jgi:two-component system sensor histidine kinase CpxA